MFLWRVVDVRSSTAPSTVSARGIGALSQRLRHVQTGLVANYALAIALGMVVHGRRLSGRFSSLDERDSLGSGEWRTVTRTSE